MEMGNAKRQIEYLLQQGDGVRAQAMLAEYEAACPEDADILSMKVMLHLLYENVPEALDYALQGVRRLPLNADMNYNLAYCYELAGCWLEAFISYQRAYYIYLYTKDARLSELDIKERSARVLDLYEDMTEQIEDRDVKEEHKKRLDIALALGRNGFGLSESAFRSYEKIVGKYYYENLFDRRFVGVFKDQFLNTHQEKDENMDVLHLKAEFLKAIEGQSLHFHAEEGQAYLLPIAADSENTVHSFTGNGETHTVVQYFAKHFNYYLLCGDTDILSSQKSYYGNPILLRQEEGRKKLILSIFVDGLSQSILEGADFEKNMPNTYRFFKKGCICTRAYNTAEWTYPSIANYVTGLDTVHHMMFHNELDYFMPYDIPTLPEYLKREGYYTAKFCGNWRIIPSYGHARGYDRFVYQHQGVGFKVHEVVSDVLNHIEAFSSTNQYVWMSVGDLHDIADGHDLPVDVQGRLPLAEREYEDRGDTSAKQEYSENKTAAYLREAGHIDRWLNYLYEYIEKNYAEDEVIISLFSDHGQGYMVPAGKHFLSAQRSNVAFMFRGGAANGLGCRSEIISAGDYSSILCRLAGIEMSDVPIQGRLPQLFGGAKEREYALTESIHPGDPYQAAVFSKEFVFFFYNAAPVSDDGRFVLADYKYWLEDLKGEQFRDESREARFLDIVLKHIAPILIYS